MIPRQLTMTAFGPYKESMTLDFDLLEDHRLFLITGPTGAGKSTIFEGLYFALYGQVSDPSRPAKSVRSDFTDDPFLETQVDFRFDVGPKTYRIRRRPAQDVPYKTKQGLQHQSAQVELYLSPDQPPLTNHKEVQAMIEAIIGLDGDQFKKIVMLPQGAFEDFLLAKSDEKRDILRHLFATEIYARLQAKAKAESQEIYRAYADAARDFDLLWAQVAAEDAQEDLTNQAQRLAYLLATIRQAGRTIQTEKAGLAAARRQEKALRADLQAIQAHNEGLRKLKASQSRRQALESQAPAMAALAEQLAAGQKAQALASVEENLVESRQSFVESEAALDEVQEAFRLRKRDRTLARREAKKTQEALAQCREAYRELPQKKDLLTNLQAYDHHAQVLSRLAREIQKGEEGLAQFQARIAADQAALARTIDHITAYQGQARHLAKALQAQAAADHAQKDLDDKQKLAASYLEALADCHTLQAQAKSSNEAQKNADHALAEARRRIRENQAAHLAQSLQAGHACPVCGSLDHPQPQAMGQDPLPDIKAVEAHAQATRLQAQEAQGAYRAQEATLKGLGQRLLDPPFALDALDDPVHALADLRQQAQESWRRSQQDLAQAQRADRVVASLRRAQGLLQHRLDDNRHTLAPLAQAQQERRYQNQQVAADQKALAAKLPEDLPDIQALSQDIADLEARLPQQEAEAQVAEAALTQAKVAYAAARSDLVHGGSRFHRNQARYDKAKAHLQAEVASQFSDFRAYEEAKAHLPELDTWRQKLAAYDKEKEVLDQHIQDLKKDLADDTFKEDAGLTQALADANRQIQACQQSLAEARVAQVQRCRLYHKLSDRAKTCQDREAAYAISKEMDLLLNGKNEARMDFETYVLSSYFEAVLGEANQRLGQMTNGRYTFTRKEGVGDRRSSQGLDIQMHDVYTGKDREASSLSGGERFKAALALALGLADVVGQASGGVELSTIFIDEGFGSLDEVSLEQTLDSLYALQDGGRLVGIISHVGELKERIQAQIQVTTGPEGSRAKFVISS